MGWIKDLLEKFDRRNAKELEKEREEKWRQKILEQEQELKQRQEWLWRLEESAKRRKPKVTPKPEWKWKIPDLPIPELGGWGMGESRKEKEGEKEMRDTDFKVGDRVRIRQWDDMEKEFGLDGRDSIDCKCSFTEYMRDEGLNGKEFIITEIDDGIVEGHHTGWAISFDMIEKVEPSKDVPAKKYGGYTKEEVLEITIARMNCYGTPCEKCLLEKKYGKEGGCNDFSKEIVTYLEEILNEQSGETPKATRAPVKREPVKQKGSCKTCSHHKDLGGYSFCQWFRNYTKPDGYCHEHAENTERKDKNV